MLLATLVIACSDDDTSTARQCSLVDGADIEEVTQLLASDGTPYEHEVSDEGTWCLYEVDGKRIELQFQPGDRATFESRRQQADREGAEEVAEFDDIGEAAFFGTAGINSTTVLVDGNLLVVQALDVVSDDAKRLTSAVARVAAARCCPP
jgi:hypothetical protein